MSVETVERVDAVARFRGSTRSVLLREAVGELLVRHEVDLRRQELLTALAAQLTPWLHDELRGLGVEDPERYGVAYKWDKET